MNLNDVDVIECAKLSIDLTNDIDEIVINENEEHDTRIRIDNGVLKIKEIDVENIKLNGQNITEELIQILLNNKKS